MHHLITEIVSGTLQFCMLGIHDHPARPRGGPAGAKGEIYWFAKRHDQVGLGHHFRKGPERGIAEPARAFHRHDRRIQVIRQTQLKVPLTAFCQSRAEDDQRALSPRALFQITATAAGSTGSSAAVISSTKGGRMLDTASSTSKGSTIWTGPGRPESAVCVALIRASRSSATVVGRKDSFVSGDVSATWSSS